ncbi:armadillo-type protein [Cantharellus anzutake]|uniref:armadillo-type protein n=1 Tax=Cantharellus anzutake TaxID=1750568 RepID=UPI001903A01F|nr:armadillo-type protein [Cantharellus anzutake]KAF8332611.1 armadillo-type protein [Cantharellus anzutake]
MSQQPNTKPSLQGVRIKAKKGAIKAQAKHEPQVFRDQLYKHLDTTQPGDFEAFSTKLANASSTLEFLKYSDSLFEILFFGGLLQPGGNFVDDAAPVSPFSIVNAKEPLEVEEIRNYVNVLSSLIRRYKYLQKPLEERSLPNLLQYIYKWNPVQREKLAVATALLIAQSMVTSACLQSLTKDHLVKDDVSLTVVTAIFRVWFVNQNLSVEQVNALLRKGNIKDILLFFPANKRSPKNALTKETIIKEMKEMLEQEEPHSAVINYLKDHQKSTALSENDFIQCIWTGLMSYCDWTSRTEPVEAVAGRELTQLAPIIEPFSSTNSKSQIALINVIQVYCHEDTKALKAFPQILKVLYNADCVSDQAIIYWYQKGSKPNGRQHFLKQTEALVKALQEQEEESDGAD